MAVQTISNAGGNWNATTTWVSGNVPVSTDTVVTSATSGNLTINVNATIAGIDFTNGGTVTYTGTITFSTLNLTLSGTLTLASGMTIAGTSTGGFVVSGTTTITTNGCVLYNISLSSPPTLATMTLADTLHVSGLLTMIGGVVNGSSMICSGSLTMNAIYQNFSGNSASITMTGTGTVTGAGSNTIPHNFIVNTSGTITFATALALAAGFTYIAGTCVVNSGHTLYISNQSATFTCTSAVKWYNTSQLNGGGTITLGGDLWFTNNYVGSGKTFNGAFTIYMGGNVTSTTGNEQIIGTASLVLNGTGTLNIGSNSASSGLYLATTINTAGTVTISSVTLNNGGSITYTAGTVITTSSTLYLAGAATTLNTSGVTWNNVQVITSTTTVTLNSLLSISGTLTLLTSTWAGTAGFSTSQMTCTTAGATIILHATNTYAVTSVLTLTGTKASRIIFKSSSTSVNTLFNLTPGATQAVNFVNAQFVDSSGGYTIHNYGGLLTTTINWDQCGSMFFFFPRAK